jgi:oxaloacetate decarboxylase gamma subunit
MSDLMSQGFDLALYGMGTVFFFLTLLIFATMAMSALLPSPELQEEVQQIEQENGGEQDRRILAAITAAIQRYREHRQS